MTKHEGYTPKENDSIDLDPKALNPQHIDAIERAIAENKKEDGELPPEDQVMAF